MPERLLSTARWPRWRGGIPKTCMRAGGTIACDLARPSEPCAQSVLLGERHWRRALDARRAAHGELRDGSLHPEPGVHLSNDGIRERLRNGGLTVLRDDPVLSGKASVVAEVDLRLPAR